MTVTTLKATNFRNFSEILLSPSPKVNVLYGDNAQGKTNLIEAIWLFSGAHSFRGSKDSEFIKFDQKFCRLELEFQGRKNTNTATIAISTTKQATLNGVKLDSASELNGNFSSVVFSPDHLDLVKAGPQNRRNFIDSAINEILPRHNASILEYRELLRQRNALLKDIPLHSELLDTLPVWNEKIAQSGARIIFTRLRYLKRLSKKANEVYDGIASKILENNSVAAENKINKNNSDFKSERLNISYFPDGIDVGEYPENINDPHIVIPKIYETLKKHLKYQEKNEIELGYTKIGPHRDDIEITIEGLSSRLFASQGQQRSIVLSLKLAEATLLKETIGESPVLLLDDVMSELDRFRQNYLLNHIDGFQVFITCCDPSGLKELKGGSIFEIEKGRIISR